MAQEEIITPTTIPIWKNFNEKEVVNLIRKSQNNEI